MSADNLGRVAVVGSGPSGVAAAVVLLERGFRVSVFDGGRVLDDEQALFSADLAQRVRCGGRPNQRDRQRLALGGESAHPTRAFLATLQTLLGGGIDPALVRKRILGSGFVFEGVDENIPLEGISLARSLATGGLSHAWGAACYPLRREDYDDWPLSERDLTPWYARAAELAQVESRRDSLSEVYPLPGAEAAAEASLPSASRSGLDQLFSVWRRHEAELERRGIRTGKSRLAVPEGDDGAHGCIRCGLCFYGCPTGAIWSSNRTIEGLQVHPGFSHRPGMIVKRIVETPRGALIEARSADRAAHPTEQFDAVFLAAGPVSSLQIAVETLGRSDVERPLKENDMFVVPFRAAHGISFPRGEPDFALSEAVLALDPGAISQFPAHIQLYRITDPLLGPLKDLLCVIPQSLRYLVLRLAQRYVIGFIYLHSRESRAGRISVRKRADGRCETVCSFSDNPEGGQIASRLMRLTADLSKPLGLRAMRRQLRLTPPGFSCHFGGTLPMRQTPGPFETALDGKLEGTNRCYVVDSSVVPEVPAQNFTLTLMANAMRVAALYMRGQT
jgi:choline dehydrogenase-like flavoprotein